MAVRNDFTAGEVLAAADLNDTFGAKLDYPTGGSDGDLLAKDGTAAEWIAVPEAGLTLITAESFSAVSSVSVNGCFSATYERYFVITRFATTNTSTLGFRLRVSGSDATSSYAGQQLGGTGGTVFASNWDTSRIDLDNNSAGNQFFIANFDRPFQATETSVFVQAFRGNNGAVSNHAGWHTATTSYTGLSIVAGTGTMTGNIRIYGYRN
jgi:hypothetical protein